MSAREAKKCRRELMRAAGDADLEGTRAALERMYGAGAHERLFADDMQWTPRVFAPLVDAAIVAKVNDATELCDEMVENIACLHEKFGVEHDTIESIRQVVELVDPDDSKEVAMGLVREQLGDTELLQHLRADEYL